MPVKTRSFVVIGLVWFASLAFAEEGFEPLFDGLSLENWQAARATPTKPFGSFSVNQAEKAIQVYQGAKDGSLQKNDCLVSNKQFSHFILRLEYKWTGETYAPRHGWDRDAGLLFHVHGDLKKVWPASLEMQIGESPGNKPNSPTYSGLEARYHTGDLFVLGKLRTTTTRTLEKSYYDPAKKPIRGKHVYTKLGTEKPLGEWNQMEIRVNGSKKACFWFNGEKVLETTDFIKVIDKDTNKPLSKGHIGIQAEWAGILYRKIEIKELTEEEAEKLTAE